MLLILFITARLTFYNKKIILIDEIEGSKLQEKKKLKQKIGDEINAINQMK